MPIQAIEPSVLALHRTPIRRLWLDGVRALKHFCRKDKEYPIWLIPLWSYVAACYWQSENWPGRLIALLFTAGVIVLIKNRLQSANAVNSQAVPTHEGSAKA